MLSLNAGLQQKHQRFLRRLQENLGVTKVTAVLERFDELDFKAFVADIRCMTCALWLTICGIDVNARIIRMLTPMAVSERRTLLSIAIPLRVNA